MYRCINVTAQEANFKIKQQAKNSLNQVANSIPDDQLNALLGLNDNYQIMIYGVSPNPINLGYATLNNLILRYSEFSNLPRKPKKIILVANNRLEAEQLIQQKEKLEQEGLDRAIIKELKEQERKKKINFGILNTNLKDIRPQICIEVITNSDLRLQDEINKSDLTIITAEDTSKLKSGEYGRLELGRANVKLMEEIAPNFKDYKGHVHVLTNLPEINAQVLALKTNMHPNQLTASCQVAKIRADATLIELVTNEDIFMREPQGTIYTDLSLLGHHNHSFVNSDEVRFYDSYGLIPIKRSLINSVDLTNSITKKTMKLLGLKKLISSYPKGFSTIETSQGVIDFVKAFSGDISQPIAVGTYIHDKNQITGFYLMSSIRNIGLRYDGRIIVTADKNELKKITENEESAKNYESSKQNLITIIDSLLSYLGNYSLTEEHILSYSELDDNPTQVITNEYLFRNFVDNLKNEIVTELSNKTDKKIFELNQDSKRRIKQLETLLTQLKENQLTPQKLSGIETKFEELTGIVSAYLKKEDLKKPVDLDLQGKLYAVDKTQQGFTKQVLEFNLFDETPVQKYKVQLGHDGSDNPGKASSLELIACDKKLYAFYSRIAKSTKKHDYGIVIWNRGVEQPKEIISLESEPVDLLVKDDKYYVALDYCIRSNCKNYEGINNIESIALIEDNLFALVSEGVYRWNTNQDSKPQLVRTFNDVHDLDSFNDSLLVGRTFSDTVIFFNPFDNKYVTFDSKEAIYSMMRYQGENYKGIVLATADINNGMPRVMLFQNESDLFAKRGETLVAPNEFNVEQIINSELNLKGEKLLMFKDCVRVLDWTQPSREAAKYSPRNALLDNVVVVYD